MTVVSGVARMTEASAWRSDGALQVYDAPDGAAAMALAEAARTRGGLVAFVARDAAQASAMSAALDFLAPDIPKTAYPAWDCLPYDRASPSPNVSTNRMAALSWLAARNPDHPAPQFLITTANAVIQRTPPIDVVKGAAFSATPGAVVAMADLTAYLGANGYSRASTVREPGEFAVRGGLVDIYPPGADEPFRLDFFGDSLESIRAFDPDKQTTTRQLSRIDLVAATEALLTEATIANFRRGYRERFGAATDDPVYEAVSAGRKYAGMEHWLPLFYGGADSLFDFLGPAMIVREHLADEAIAERLAAIDDYYRARQEDLSISAAGRKSEFSAPAYRPLRPAEFYLDLDEWRAGIDARPSRELTPFSPPEGRRTFSFGAKVGRTFAAERAADGVNVFDAVIDHVADLEEAGKRTYLACWSAGSADRMAAVLADHGLKHVEIHDTWRGAQGSRAAVTAVVWGLDRGFETKDAAFISEQDILGDRLVRRGRKKRAENFLTEASSLDVGDFIVHVDHGVGRYMGLKTLDVQGAPVDCLQLEYAGGDKLFLPVVNIDLLTRFGSDDPLTQLDRLGGAAWQSRKAKMRARVRMLAEQLIAIAAKRAMKETPTIHPAQGPYDEFCARFPYAETEDQENAIADVLEDLARGRPMDRLVCGDVGFGKTEVALRAAFIVAMTGRQVAVIAPTTLLARQHFKNFAGRFKGFPVNVRPLSRLVSSAEATKTRAGLADGQVDVVIGTHALLAKSVRYRDLGMVIIDEEQRFGVKHKERLKEFRSDTHVLTLTATPIPRTLQLAMSGIRDLSLISTPPIDRLAVRTTVGPFDPVIARETLLREHYRGGQSFYVAPRIADLDGIAEFLRDHVPEVKFQVAHGQMSGGELEDVMNNFYDGKFDVLVSTTIIESGLDIPTANTMIIHRADNFGLAQLYQLRGRIGRAKARAYAYLTTSPRVPMTEGAQRRLKVMQSLDSLGAGFTLASHDLDIRGAGNLLGEEQSGQVREVGVELYQHMLEEAVAQVKEGDAADEGQWSPQINIGASVLIPEAYVEDLSVRMGLYRRLGDLRDQGEIDSFAAELVDRFGPSPAEVDHLLQIISIREKCREAGVEKIDAGPKGAVVSFRRNEFANPAGLVGFISQSAYEMKLRPDQKLVFQQNWPDERARLRGCRKILDILTEIAAEAADSH
ncbi:MAG: transcription-repair coupling factor [Alphaproteobacteria bacterium]|nr:transcription-repair coupling factor [Alphaproteobacteria bacterium]